MTKTWPLLFALAACTDDPEPAFEPTAFTARVRGPLAGPDLAAAKARHDGIAMGAHAQATAAGDFAHHVLLGTEHAGTPRDEFLAIDQWTSLDGANALYGDPDFQAAQGTLFTAPPNVQLFARRTDWHSWGEMGSGRTTGQPFWFAIVQGRLARDTVADNQLAHDEVAGGNEAIAAAAGDIAHLPHLAVDDPRVFFNVDIWSSEQGMLATFGNPDFQAQFQTLFESPPEVRIYRSTDWYQWYAP